MAYTIKQARPVLLNYLGLTEENANYIENTDKWGITYENNDLKCVIFMMPLGENTSSPKIYFDIRDSGAEKFVAAWKYAESNDLKFFCLGVKDENETYKNSVISVEADIKTVLKVSGLENGRRSGSGTQLNIPKRLIPNGNVTRTKSDKFDIFFAAIDKSFLLTYLEIFDNRLFQYIYNSNNLVSTAVNIDCIPIPHNRIIFGAPGTGKSHSLEQERENNFADDCYERVTFHPNSSYAQFVGTYKPTMTVKETDSSLTDEQKQILSILKDKNRSGQEKYDLLYDKFRDDSDLTRLPLLIGIYSDDEFRTKKADGSYTANDNGVERNHGRAVRPYVNLNLDCVKEEITYEYIPGPFMRIYKAAKQNPSQNFLLLIEEINRANVAAVFGDVFQLLDRDENGNSEYPVAASEDIKKYLAKNGIHEDELKIPSNMYIWATMNSADQGVFPMDTAFKRRWEFEYIGINENEKEVKKYSIPICKDGKISQKVNWNDLRKAINNKLITLGINEDKLLGPFFLSKTVLDSAFDKGMDFVKLFESKVLMYLFEDAAKMKAKQLFNVDEKKFIYSEVCKKFEEIGVKVFKFNDEDVVEEHDISSKEDAVPTEGKLF